MLCPLQFLDDEPFPYTTPTERRVLVSKEELEALPDLAASDRLSTADPWILNPSEPTQAGIIKD
jgi:hypothetical protein